MRQPLVIGNWKMHGSRASNAQLLDAVKQGVAELAGVGCAVCVPFPYLTQVKEAAAGSRLAWGAQNVSEHPSGAYTGEVAALMLKDFECRYVLVGHSERRSLYGETDAQVAAKFAAAIASGLTPVLCVGESLAERDAGETMAVVSRQIDAVLSRSGVAGFSQAVVAYEPVWAIGTGRTATPDQAEQVHAAIREQISGQDPVVGASVQILYGGSVKPQNAVELFAKTDIDGGLIGGASLIADDFLAICRAANQGK